MLLLTDRVDEWMLSHLYEFDGKPLQSVAKGAVDLGKLQDEAEKKQAEEAAEAFKPVLERLKEALKDRAKDVRVTTRLVDSPACLVVEEGDMSGHLARLLKQAGQGAPASQPMLEVNAEHALVKRLEASEHFDDLANILFDQALLAEGGQLDDPAAYVRRVNALLVGLSARRSARSGRAAERRLGHRLDLLAQLRALLGPVGRAREPRKGDREGRVAPAARDPGAVVDHAQRAQRLDEAQLAPVEVHEGLVALEHGDELARHRRAVAREQHPQVLHRRAGDGVVEVDEVRAGVGPQDVAGVAVAVQAERARPARLSKARCTPRARCSASARQRRRRRGGTRSLREQEVAAAPRRRSSTSSVHAVRERRDVAPTACRRPMKRPSQSTSAVLELGRAAGAALGDAEAVALAPARAQACERRAGSGDRGACGERASSASASGAATGISPRGELGREGVLLEDLRVAPAPRPIELGHDDVGRLRGRPGRRGSRRS